MSNNIIKSIKVAMIVVALGSGVKGIVTEYQTAAAISAASERTAQLEKREAELEFLIAQKQLEMEMADLLELSSLLEMADLAKDKTLIETVEL